MNELSLINLANAIENNERAMTDEELDILLIMFYQKYGTARNGMCINPRFLIKDPVEGIHLEEKEYTSKEETLAVRKWQEQEDIDLIEGIEHPDKSLDIGFMCEKPQNCSSNLGYRFNCKCIRENFENPTQFNKWVDKTINELGTELKDLIPSRKRNSSFDDD